MRAPDSLAVVDAEDGRVVHETPMPNAGDELHHFGWNRCSSACHGPDRSHLVLPGFRSSRVHVLNVADDPRRPRIEHVIEPEEIARATGYSRPHTVHCMPGDNVVLSMLGDADGNGAGGFACLDASTFEVKGRWENGGARPGLRLRLLVPAAQGRARVLRVRRAQRVRVGLRSRARRAGPLRAAAPLLEARRARARADDRPRRPGTRPAGDPDAPRPGGGGGLRRGRAVERHLALPARERRVGRGPGHRRRPRRARRLADRRAGPDHRHRRLDGRPLPVSLELAPRRPAPVRHLRSRASAADRRGSGSAGCWAGRATRDAS